MSTLFGLDCPECGADVFLRAENVYREDEAEVCQECGTCCLVRIEPDPDGDEDHGEVWAAGFGAQDKGQSRCDGSCGSVKEHHGEPCLWTCPRAKGDPA